jgi:hypothetical protein
MWSISICLNSGLMSLSKETGIFSPLLESLTLARLKSNVRLTESGAAAESVGVLLKTWLRRRAHRVKPATDVYLGMRFTAVMAGSSCVGRLRIPPVNGKIRISTSNDEPVDGICGHDSTHFTSKFFQRCHALSPHFGVNHLHFAVDAGRRLGVRIVSSPTCSLLAVPRRWAA